MELTSCIKGVVMATGQYQNNTNDANTVNVQRQLDVLITVTGRNNQLKMFDPRQMLPTECLTCIADILNDRNTKPSLIHKCLTLLNNLSQDNEIREMLHGVFHFTPILASLIRVSRGTSGDPLISDCLTLLQRITYGQRIPLHESHIEELINFLIKNIQGGETLLTRPALGLLANLCRNNNSIKSFIKSQEKIRAFYRCLISYLSHENLSLIIFSLSVLTSLCLQEELGEKLYHGKNINKTFQLIFNILINGDSVTSRPYAVDLFIDIIKNMSIQASLLVFDHLSMCMKEVLNLLTNNTSEATKIFELLLSFCQVSELRHLLCKELICVGALQDRGQISALYQCPPGQLNHPFLAMIQIAGQSVDTHGLAPLLALEFLKEMYEYNKASIAMAKIIVEEYKLLQSKLARPLTQRPVIAYKKNKSLKDILELVFTGGGTDVNPHLELVLPLVNQTLMINLSQAQTKLLKKQSQKIVRAVEILMALCEDDSMRKKLSQALDIQTLIKHIDFQFNNNKIAIRPSTTHSDPEHWYEDGVDVVLNILKLLSKLRGLSQVEEYWSQALQDSRVIPFLAYGITSDTRSRVQMSIGLIASGCSLNGFSSIILGDCIAAHNNRNSQLGKSAGEMKRQYNNELVDKENIPVNKYSAHTDPMMEGTGKKITEEQEASIQTLIDRMQKGFDVKDIRPSEMISVYEQKLKCLQTKEHHLQDLLEAKALALTQADHLLVQYRSQRAQSEAELSRMRSLVQESEERSEEYRDQLNSIISQRERLQHDQEELILENRRLEAVEEDYKEISSAFSEQSQKLEKAQKSLSSLKQEHKSLSEMQEMLQRHNETLKQQHDVATQQLAELEDTMKNVQRQLKDRESKLSDVSKSYHKLEEIHKSVSSEKNELEEAIDKLRTELTKAEQNKKHLQHQVTSLELLCQKHETAIQEKDNLIEAQKEEIGKHHQIAALIHNLSGGKGIDPPK